MTTPTGSSRIIVKNIGKTTTESHLRDLFNRKGEVTDVRIQKTKSGKSREFAFIGFRTEQQAVDAQRYFNNTFIQTSRITVDIAKSIHDPTLLVSSKSRHTKQKLEKQKILLKKENEMNSKKGKEFDENKEMNKPGNERQERAKAEFLQVMKSRRSGNVWGNDDAHIQIAQEKLQQEYNVKEQEQERSDNEDGDESDHSEDNDFVSKLSASKSSKTSSKLSQKFTHDSDSDSGDDGSGSEDEIVKGKSTSAVSDLDFLRSKVKKNIKEDSDSESDSNSESESEFEEEKEDEDEDDKEEEMEVVKNDSDSGVTENGGDIEENVEEDGRLFIRNLPYSVSEDEVTELFSKFGPLSQVHLPLNEDKRGKGYGFVQFMIPEHSENAMTALDGTSFQGRLLHIIRAKAQQSHSEENTNSSKNSHLSSFQKKKEEERKKMANKREGWNASYVRSDTVIDSLSDKYGVSRGDILDTDGVGGGELAVRLAIGETQVIQENKEYFLSHGVDIDTLESALSSTKSSSTKSSSSKSVERSTTTVLIKNLPHDVVGEELEEMFTRFGSVASFLLPPSKTVALIDFVEPSDARKAFTNLAYRRYHHVPLYLEWAPLNTISKKKNSQKSAPATTPDLRTDSSSKPKQKKESTIGGTVGVDDSADYSTLYLKNLNFQTSESDLQKHLENRLGINGSDIRTISIPKKQSKSGHSISMGYGFVEFKTIQGAVKMLSRINGSRLDEHVIEAKPSDKRLSVPQQSLVKSSRGGGSGEGEASNPNETNKLIVRNVAFQATKEELKTLFSAFGTIKTLRIPRKIGGVHRGFAFIDFNTKQEATRAMNALSRTHMYGRHLVIEYAKNEDDLDEKEKLVSLREKAEQNMKSMQKLSQSRKRKAGEILESQTDVDLTMV